MRSLLRVILLSVLAAGFSGSSHGSAQNACGEFAVAVAVQPPGKPLTNDQIALDLDGQPVGAFDFQQPRSVRPTSLPGVSIVRSLGGRIALLDPSFDELIEVNIPAEQQPLIVDRSRTLTNPDGLSVMLLGDDAGHAWLVDLTSGAAIDLLSLDSLSTRIESAALDPTGAWLLYQSNSGANVLHLTAGSKPVPLDSGTVLPGAHIAPDGSTIRYAVGDSGGSVAIRAFDPMTGQRNEIGLVSGVQSLLPVPTDRVLASTARSIGTVTANGSLDTVVETRGTVTASWWDPAVAHLLLQAGSDDASTYWWVDMEVGRAVQVSDLDGSIPITESGATSSAVLFAPTSNGSTGTPGAPYRLLDLETGSLETLLVQDSREVWSARAAGDAAGRFAVVQAVSPGSGRLWLVDSAERTVVPIGSSTGNVDGAVSADGCRLAIWTYDTLGEGRVSHVEVRSLVDGQDVAVIPDSVLLGWAEVPAATTFGSTDGQ